MLGPLALPVTREFPLSLGWDGGGRVSSRRAAEEKEMIPLLTAQNLRENSLKPASGDEGKVGWLEGVDGGQAVCHWVNVDF